MKVRLNFLFCVFVMLLAMPQVKADSICEQPLKYEVMRTDQSAENFFLVIGNKKMNVYRRGSDFIVEWKKKKELWLFKGQSYSPYPWSEMYIDSIYFQNISESSQKELVVAYSLFGLRSWGSNKSKHLLVMDLTEKKVILNIATYDYRVEKDENGKLIEYLYEADVELSHNMMEVNSTDDSDIDNAVIQLDDGVYVRHGHCFTRK